MNTFLKICYNINLNVSIYNLELSTIAQITDREQMKKYESDYEEIHIKCELIGSDITHLSTHYDMGVAMAVRREQNFLPGISRTNRLDFLLKYLIFFALTYRSMSEEIIFFDPRKRKTDIQIVLRYKDMI